MGRACKPEVQFQRVLSHNSIYVIAWMLSLITRYGISYKGRVCTIVLPILRAFTSTNAISNFSHSGSHITLDLCVYNIVIFVPFHVLFNKYVIGEQERVHLVAQSTLFSIYNLYIIVCVCVTARRPTVHALEL